MEGAGCKRNDSDIRMSGPGTNGTEKKDPLLSFWKNDGEKLASGGGVRDAGLGTT